MRVIMGSAQSTAAEGGTIERCVRVIHYLFIGAVMKRLFHVGLICHGFGMSFPDDSKSNTELHDGL